MNFKLVLLCLLGSLFSMQAQNTATINGKVTDKTTHAPISYVSIVVKEDNKVVTGGITDDNGLFEIKNLALKNYSVEVQYMGYKTFVAAADFTSGQKNVSLGTISLQDEATQLNDVTVIAERSTIEQKIDRKVINVGKDLTTAGATASDIMNNIPSVNVDQDGKLSLRGNENVRVLVDGRPTNIDAAQLLKQIPSASIKKIELITNPSAKYNPEGMSGIINIVLHKNANDGFNASINSGITIGESVKNNNSVNMNYRIGKVNFFGMYGNSFGKHFNDGHIRRFDDSSLQRFDIVNDDNSHLFKIGMDYYIDDKNTFSVYTNQNFSSGIGDVNVLLVSPVFANNFYQQAKYGTDNHDGAYNMAYKHLFKKEGETLDIEVNYADYKQPQNGDFNTNYFDPSRDDIIYQDYTDEKRKNTTVNVDYVKPLNDKTTLELGAEARYVRTENFYTSNITTPALVTFYDYDQDIYSAYATFGQKFKKISYQLGARFESYKVNATLDSETAYKDDYFTLYPSASFVYSPTEKNQFQLSYSRRVDRPSLEQTKPIREFSTPLLTSVGNPALNPQFTSSVELNYTRTLEGGTITGGVFVRAISDEITRVVYPDPENPETKQIMTFQNFDDNTAFGFEVSANYKINKWWDIQPSIDFSGIKQKGTVTIEDPDNPTQLIGLNREVNANAFNARMNNNFKATKNLRFLLFGFYRGAVSGVQFNGHEMYKIDAGARYSLLKDKATISLRVNDIFNTQHFSFDGQYPHPQAGTFGWESRTVYIGFNYIFGAGKNKALQRKQREDNTKQGGGGLF
ncbi:MAG TPA: TonB-dependent receptor [Flavobacterium sp.]|nr:TonB-dependent receptor [Flavobacterium sp.]